MAIPFKDPSSSVAKPSPEQFCFWFKGVLDSNPGFLQTGIDAETTAGIMERLDSVFTHVAPVAAKAPRTMVERWIAPSGTLPPKGQCQEPGECRGAVCDNPNCGRWKNNAPPGYEAMC